MSTPIPKPYNEPDWCDDEVVVVHDVSWSAYETQLALRGEKSVPRIAYLDGTMELMTPGRLHERVNGFLGRLIEVYALERDIEFSPYGRWTQRNAAKRAGLEPDECYIIGPNQTGDRPDLAIEVVVTSGSIKKLEIYRRLGIPEVWFWRKGAITIHVLRGEQYETEAHSSLLPGIDLQQLMPFLDYPSASQAIRAYRKALGGG